MSIGGNIKVTLTLNDAGFTVKAKQASNSVKQLNTDIKGASGQLGKMEKVVEKTTTRLTSVSEELKQLKTSTSAASKSVTGLTQQNEQLQAVVKSLISSFKSLNGATKDANATQRTTIANSAKVAKFNRDVAKSNDELTKSTKATADGMTRQERALKNLIDINGQVLKSVQVSALGQKDAVARSVASQIQDNDKLVVSKKNSLASMLRAEKEYNRQAEAARSKMMATQMLLDNRRDPKTGRMISAKSDQYKGWEQQLIADRQHLANLERSAQIVSQEAAKQQAAIAAEVTKGQTLRNNLAIRESELKTIVAEQERSKAAAVAARQAAKEQLDRQRQVREELRQQNIALRDQANMVKGLAQMWASMKIAQAEKSSLNEAAGYQVDQYRAKAMGLTPQQQRQFREDSENDSAKHRGVSVRDAAEARLATMGGLATTDRNVVNSILPELIEGAKNVQFLKGDDSREGYRDLVRNLSGFIEARQQQYDPKASKSSIDLVTQISAATGGKIDLQDLETILRRMGAGANQVSDNGLRNIVALMDQAKVAGGGSGGGAGGVSTVGTMIKMLQAYGNGKTKTNQSVKALVEAGILDTSVADPNKSFASQMKMFKNLGFKSQKELNTDPVGYFIKMTDLAFKSMTSNDKQKQKYFGDKDADIHDPELRRAALTKWATQQGYTTTATSMFTMAGDERFQERMHHQNDMIKGSQNNKQVSEDRLKSYKGVTDAFDASLNNLKVTMGESILPMMTSFFEWLDKVVKKCQSFAKDNPMVTQLTMIAGGIGSVVLGLKGMLGAFSLVRGGLGLFTSLGGEAGAAAGKVGLFKTAINFLKDPLATTSGLFKGVATLGAKFGNVLTTLLNPMNLIRGSANVFRTEFALMGTNLGKAVSTISLSGGKLLPFLKTLFGSALRITGVFATSMGRIFLRMIPFVGWLITAWDLGSLLLSIQVGGHKISEWMTNWLQNMLGEARKMWNSMLGIFGSSAIKAQVLVQNKAIDEARAAREFNFNEKGKAGLDVSGKPTKQEENVGGFVSGIKWGAPQKLTPEDHKGKPATTGGNTTHGSPPKNGSGKKTPSENDINTSDITNDIDWGDDGGNKPKRGFEDPFVSSMAEMRRKAQTSALRRDTRIVGNTTDDLDKEARIAFSEKWNAGDFDPGHDPNKRKFKSADGSINWSAKSGGYSPEDWVQQYKDMKQAEEQQKAMEYAAQRSAAAQQDLSAAMERTTGETGKQNRDVLALERELTRASVRLKNGTADWNAWAAEKAKALATKTGATLVNYTADFADGDRSSMRELAPDGKTKQTADIDRAIANDREQYEALKTSHKKYYEEEQAALLAQLTAGELTREVYNEKAKESYKNYTDAAIKAETAFTQHAKIQAALRERAAETSTDKLAREWKNTYSAVETMQSNWASSFMDNLTTVMEGGSVSWKSFLLSMVEDIYKAKVKEAFSDVISNVFGGIGDLLKNSLFSNESTGSTGATLTSALSGAGSTIAGWFGGNGSSSSATGTVSNGSAAGTTNDAAATATTALAAGAKAANEGLETMTNNGIWGSITAMAQNIISLFTGTAASTSKATADTSGAVAATGLSLAMTETALAATGLTVALAAAAAAAAGNGISNGVGAAASAIGSGVSAFANGGIMSSMGSLPLKKYANGGIANSPQLALFGEGAMKEAYVPLPDGRSIPVTMSGDVASGSNAPASVVISIQVDNNGDSTQSSDGSNGSDAKQWNTVAARVKTLVIDTLIEQKRTNGILAKN